MQLFKRSASAFTLAEIMVAGGVVAICGGMIFTFLSIGMTLYTQNISIYQTHSAGLLSTQKLLLKVAAASEVPVLVDDTGANLAGNGPAAGVRFFSPTSSQAYPVPFDVSATATSFTITKPLNQPAPQAGDKIVMADLGFQGVITTVSGSGSSYIVGFASTVGSGFIPPKTTGTVILALPPLPTLPPKCFLMSPSAFISVNGVLRHYPRALSVAQQGAAAFNSPANFSACATVLPASGQTNCLPFRYLNSARRSVDVNLRVRAPAHGSRIGAFYTFQNMKTTVAYRSAINQ